MSRASPVDYLQRWREQKAKRPSNAKARCNVCGCETRPRDGRCKHCSNVARARKS